MDEDRLVKLITSYMLAELDDRTAGAGRMWVELAAKEIMNSGVSLETMRFLRASVDDTIDRCIAIGAQDGR